MKRVALYLIRFYRGYISPAFPPTCRFYPSCSQYSYEVIERHGLVRGAGLIVKRLLKCHPYHPGGYDPAP